MLQTIPALILFLLPLAYKPRSRQYVFRRQMERDLVSGRLFRPMPDIILRLGP